MDEGWIEPCHRYGWRLPSTAERKPEAGHCRSCSFYDSLDSNLVPRSRKLVIRRGGFPLEIRNRWTDCDRTWPTWHEPRPLRRFFISRPGARVLVASSGGWMLGLNARIQPSHGVTFPLVKAKTRRRPLRFTALASCSSFLPSSSLTFFFFEFPNDSSFGPLPPSPSPPF